MEVMESIDDLSVSRNKIIINSTQKVSSRVLNSRNMMSVARTSYTGMCYIHEELELPESWRCSGWMDGC